MAQAFRLTVAEAVSSTNELVKRAIAEGEPEGAAFRAHMQTGGYGRQGRAWASPVGGMYESVLLRPQVPQSEVPTLALVAGLAVRAAAQRFAPAACAQVKWPNDVVCAQGKLCGISAEMHVGAVCLGIGVNVFEPSEAQAVGGKNVPAYLASFRGGESDGAAARVRNGALSPDQRALVDSVGDVVLEELAARYGVWEKEGFAPFLAEYREHMAFVGCEITVTNRGGGLIAAGRVREVDEQGRLILETADGDAAVASGEAHIASIAG